MKTKLSITIVFIALIINANAQINVGAKIGANLKMQSEIGNIYYSNDELNPGFNLGAFVNYSFGNIFSLQTEYIYQQKGGVILNNNDDVTYNYDCLSIPVLSKFSFGEQLGISNPNKVFFNVGPYGSFIVNAKQEKTLNGETNEKNITNDTERFDYGIAFGGGYEFRFLARQSFIEFRYDLGLNKVTDDKPDYRNKAITLNIGINF